MEEVWQVALAFEDLGEAHDDAGAHRRGAEIRRVEQDHGRLGSP